MIQIQHCEDMENEKQSTLKKAMKVKMLTLREHLEKSLIEDNNKKSTKKQSIENIKPTNEKSIDASVH